MSCDIIFGCLEWLICFVLQMCILARLRHTLCQIATLEGGLSVLKWSPLIVSVHVPYLLLRLSIPIPLLQYQCSWNVPTPEYSYFLGSNRLCSTTELYLSWEIPACLLHQSQFDLASGAAFVVSGCVNALHDIPSVVQHIAWIFHVVPLQQAEIGTSFYLYIQSGVMPMRTCYPYSCLLQA